MTALKKYARLEATGLWRERPVEQRREVIVSVGNTSLIIADSKDRPLAHWSLAAIARANPGEFPARYHPDGDTEESLEFTESEAEMVKAIEKLRRVIDRRRPKPGRLRLIISAMILATVCGLAVFWLPQAVQTYALRVVPDVKRHEIGVKLIEQMASFSGKPCRSDSGNKALNLLSQRLLGAQERLWVLPTGVAQTAHVPGGLILLNREVLEDFEDPDVVAGFVLVESLRAAQHDSLADLLSFSGTLTVFRLLTTGRLSDNTLKEYAQHLLLQPQAKVANSQLIKAFGDLGLRAAPYAYAIDVTGESTLDLIEADSASRIEFTPSLADNYWIRLQAICGG